jgi:predicted TIM-barrel fold metal-dependent hydrolase
MRGAEEAMLQHHSAEELSRRDPSRRQMIAGLAAVGGLGLLPRMSGAIAAPARRAVDFHHHFNPPFLVSAAAGNRVGANADRLNWGISFSLENMDKAGIASAIITPPTGFAERTEPAGRVAMVRRTNEYGAELVRDHRGRYLQLVYMPLPDVDAALKEIEYGFDTLNVVGAGFATSYGGKYVSDPDFAPVFDELNRRGAICYFHPLAPACCASLFADLPEEASAVEIPYDTGRAVMSLLLRGVFAKYRNIKWVFSHSGGAVPMFAGRWKNLLAHDDVSKVAPDGIDAEFARLYYETANANSPPTMAALLKFAPLSQVMFGSDHPYVTDEVNMNDLLRGNLPTREMNAILYENAQRLVPRLRG